jgi:hypothetical protein
MAIGGIVRDLVNKIGFQVDNSGANKAEGHFTRLQGLSQKLNLAVGGFFSTYAAKGMVTNLLSVTSQVEQLNIAFSVLLKSQEKADNLMDDIKKVAIASPIFSFVSLAKSAKEMVAYGFSVDEVLNEIQMLGDVASGVGMPLGDLTYVYGTLKSQGRAITRDIMQFTGRGIPIIEELAKILKVDATQIKNLVEEGKVGFPQVQQAFKNMTIQGGRFSGMAEKIGTSLGGLWANFTESISLMLSDIGKQMLPFFKRIMSSLLSVFSWLNENISPIMKTIIFVITTITLAIIPLTLLISLINLELLPVYGTILLIAGILALIGLAFDDIYTYIKGGDSLIGKWLPPFETFKFIIKDIQEIFKNIGGMIANVRFGNWVGFKKNIEAIKKAFFDLVDNQFFRWIERQTSILPKFVKNVLPIDVLKSIAQPYNHPFVPNLATANNTSASNRINNLNTTVNITVPPGKSKQQADYLKWSAEEYFSKELEKTSRKIIASNKEIE